MIAKYICEYCGKEFTDEFACEWHETDCTQNPYGFVYIKVPCQHAIKDCHSYIASECKYDMCGRSVRVERSKIEEIIKHQPYRYENVGVDILECVSLTDPTFRFYGTTKIKR